MLIARYGMGEAQYFGLHGWGGDHSTFAVLAEHLPLGATLYACDLPGYGKSPAPPEWKAERVAEAVAAAIAQLDLRGVTLIGNCSGAIIALLTTQLIAERVARLILIDPFAVMPWYFRIFLSPGWGKYAYRTTFANPLGRWLTNLSLRHRRTDETHLTASFRQINHETTYRYLAMLGEIAGFERFKDVRVPIELLYGERSFAAIKNSVALWQSIWPQARAHELAGAGHLPLEEATQQLCRIVFEPVTSAVEEPKGRVG